MKKEFFFFSQSCGRSKFFGMLDDPWLNWLHSRPPPPPAAAAQAYHALGLARLVAAAWEAGGGGPAGLAAPLFDGRADALAAAVGATLDAAFAAVPPPSVLEIDGSDYAEVDAAVTRALVAGVPSVVRGGAATTRVAAAWSTPAGAPHWRAFGASFPGQEGRITDCSSRTDVRVPASVPAFAEAMEADDASNHTRNLYLKDVQFDQTSPPGFLSDAVPAAARPGPGGDWLSHAAETVGRGDTSVPRPPSYRFVYAGPAAACTPLHCDVYGSHAVSANAAGCKRWTFVAPADAPKLYDRFGRHTAKWLDGRDEGDADIMYPWLATVRAVAVDQGPGDVVCVPCGWWHSVENITPSISLNINFIDAASAATAVAAVLTEHADADAVAAGGGGSVPRPPAPARQLDGSSLVSADGVGVDGFARVVVAAASRDAGAVEAALAAGGRPLPAAVAGVVAAPDALAQLESYARLGGCHTANQHGCHAAALHAGELRAVGKAARDAAARGCAALGVASREE